MQERREDNVLPFAFAGALKRKDDSTALAIAIVIGSTVVQLVRTLAPLAVLLLAAIGILRLIGH